MLLRGLGVGLGIPERTKLNPVKFLHVSHCLPQALQIGRATVPAVLDGGCCTQHVLDLGNGEVSRQRMVSSSSLMTFGCVSADSSLLARQID